MRIKFTVKERVYDATKENDEVLYYVPYNPRELNMYGNLTLIAEYVYNYKKCTLSENFWAENLDYVKKCMIDKIKEDIEEVERKESLIGYTSVEEI